MNLIQSRNLADWREHGQNINVAEDGKIVNDPR